MPPASLSTLAVMIPGPTTARNSRVRPLQRFRSFMRAFRRHRDYDNPGQECARCFAVRSRARGRIRIHGEPLRGIDENEDQGEKSEMRRACASLEQESNASD